MSTSGCSAGSNTCLGAETTFILVTLGESDGTFVSLIGRIVDEEENKDRSKHEPLQTDLEDA